MGVEDEGNTKVGERLRAVCLHVWLLCIVEELSNSVAKPGPRCMMLR